MNAREQIAHDRILAEYPNAKIFNTGWPDFLVVPDSGEDVHAVEVKSATDPLREDQASVHFWLNDCGIPTGVMTVESGVVAGFDPLAYMAALYA